jgi:hypothetical protein
VGWMRRGQRSHGARRGIARLEGIHPRDARHELRCRLPGMNERNRLKW